ncbi:MAG: DUF4493 domain-containing protein [Bacteroidales bacterium]|nr:DUF4493 domain-containing protein [Bacteroidales bacterium]
MKMKHVMTLTAAVAAVALATSSCEDFFDTPKAVPGLEIHFADDWSSPARASASLPDTNDFILTVRDASGALVFEGSYGSAPATLTVAPGNYTVSAVSMRFSEPRFEAPCYGDTQVAVVVKGQTSRVELYCTQVNSGLRLRVAPSFREAYPGAQLQLRCSEGRLAYAYGETRTAYFLPGPVSLLMMRGGDEQLLLTRTLEARQVLSLGLGASAREGVSGIDIQLDTARRWLSEDVLVGGAGEDKDAAYSVGEVAAHAGEGGVWVYGYIVGGDLTSSKCSFEPPFTSRTNLVLAAKSSVTDRSACISVQLSKGDIRDALNLVDHPENLGKQLWLKGDIVPVYYGLPGLQALSDFEWK